MKNIKLSFIPVWIFLLGTILFSSCWLRPEKPHNPCCQDFEAKTKNYGPDTTLTFYSAFTPKYYPFCDSLVYSPAQGEYLHHYSLDGDDFVALCTHEQAEKYISEGYKDKCPCRNNPNEANNDEINDKFEIDGIEKFPCNKLYIRKPNDTMKIATRFNFNNTGDAFNGQTRMDSTPIGRSPIDKMLASGLYEYELIIYKGKNAGSVIPTDEHGCYLVGGRPVYKETYVLDTIKGNFCIIRPGQENSGCKVKKPDPLIN